jgi:hypothetical protein
MFLKNKYACVSQNRFLSWNSKVTPQTDSPIGIFSYKASKTDNGSVNHQLTLLNKTKKNIIAVEFGIWSFDAFDGYLGERFGLYMKDVIRSRYSRGVVI